MGRRKGSDVKKKEKEKSQNVRRGDGKTKRLRRGKKANCEMKAMIRRKYEK